VKISIFDYGAGNLQSVQNTLAKAGIDYELIRDAEGIAAATKIILPGVGHFGQMMRTLDELGVRDAFVGRIREGVPFLGICLGMQALFTGSEEAPEQKGFGLFEGTVRRFTGALRIPHMGWDELDRAKPSRLLEGLGEQPFVYFAHSYYAPVVAATAATCTYDVPYTAVLEQDNVYGVQFHPEKSGDFGLRIVQNFSEM
jgi:imidazole glycerol phosphate synthase glutamine amidotransferase subunit